ncbi:NUDIX domain-containing protein [Actinotalea sp. K2]|uniref:NUDIX domain-containing protein n=1 Tax=Actinotalea sp. K2 TaxID=2939438 RepID=UPI002016BED6|nr:NUDIX domain-containing protein [Actinotalea sp. K2]MCL3859467.1 NUDIX domain-containing protein [Actinotalea sp. K2]
MPAEPFRLAAAVYGILHDGERILMIRRARTGYRDGQLSLPAGHLDGDEDAVTGLVRELREEVGVEADPDSCRLALLMHAAPEHAADREYLHLFFTVGRWHGKPTVAEPDKCDDLLWTSRTTMPNDVVDYVAEALDAIARGEQLALRGW